MQKSRCGNFLYKKSKIAEETLYYADLSTACISMCPQQRRVSGQQHTGQQKGQTHQHIHTLTLTAVANALEYLLTHLYIVSFADVLEILPGDGWKISARSLE